MENRTHYNRRHGRTALAAIATAVLSLASAAHAQLVGQVVAGTDNGRNARVIATDSAGRLLVIGSASGGSVYGPDAIGSPGTQPPVRIGGSASNTTAGSSINSWKVDTAGLGYISGFSTSGTSGVSNGLLVGGSDGTNYRHFHTDTSGNLMISGLLSNGVSGSSSLGSMTGGSDGTNYRHFHVDTSGNLSITSGGVFNTTLPTLTTGQRGDAQLTSRGSLNVAVYNTAGAALDIVNNTGDGQASGYQGVIARAYTYVYNGSTLDHWYGANAANQNGVGVGAVALIPCSANNCAITPVVSGSLESGHVLKASAGNLYRLTVTSSISGYILVFNSITVPADGAVTPQMCRVVNAGSTEIDHTAIPDRFATGISVAFSTTGCFTKTASATAMIEGSVQ